MALAKPEWPIEEFKLIKVSSVDEKVDWVNQDLNPLGDLAEFAIRYTFDAEDVGSESVA